MMRSVSEPPLAWKLAMVSGNSNSELAKIGGMTPAVLSFSGMAGFAAEHFIALLAFGVLHNDAALRTLHEHDEHDEAEDGGNNDENERRSDNAGAAQFQRAADGRRQVGDDTGENDKRNTVADAARGNLLTQPHQENRAAAQRDGGGEQEEHRPDRSPPNFLRRSCLQG